MIMKMFIMQVPGIDGSVYILDSSFVLLICILFLILILSINKALIGVLIIISLIAYWLYFAILRSLDLIKRLWGKEF